MQLEEHYRRHPSMLDNDTNEHEKIDDDEFNYEHVARPVTVLSSADCMSRTLAPTFSMMPAPFSYE
jgi:hypothetical protein